ncbi:helix-turn-helix domain-containing protein [Amycolatopsis sp. NPDC059027]|uniref:helix-turn-helix domain-containing protein n=1 Tax=unclassified Amycolatopsis TaxID=2618356 RepID=UPI00366CEE18
MSDPSTARYREVGFELRTWRESNELTCRELSRQTGLPLSSLSFYENGRRAISSTDAAVYLAICGAPRAERERIIDLTAVPNGDLYWVRPYFDSLVDPLKSLIIQENLAQAIINYEPMTIPGLLQTESYARAVFEAGQAVATDRIDRLVGARMDRQNLLEKRNPPHCTFYVHERAIREGVGGPAVMHEQVQYLTLAMNLPCCTVRLVPESLPRFRAFPTPFRLMDYDDHPALTYIDVYVAALFIDHRPAVEAFYEVSSSLEQGALSEAETAHRLARYASEYERMQG